MLRTSKVVDQASLVLAYCYNVGKAQSGMIAFEYAETHVYCCDINCNLVDDVDVDKTPIPVAVATEMLKYSISGTT